METNHLFELSNVKGEDRVYLTLHILKKILESGQLNIASYTKNTRIIEDSNKTMLPTCGNNVLAKLASGLYSFCYNGLPSVWSGDNKSNENVIESYIENITLDTMETSSPEQLLQIFIVYANCVQGYSREINDYFVEKILEVIPDQFYTRLGLMLNDNINVEIPAIDIETESFEIKDLEQYKEFLKDQKALQARNGITIPSAIFNIRANSVTLLSPSQVNDHINEEHTNIDKFENIVEKEVVQIPQETMVEIEKKINEEPVEPSETGELGDFGNTGDSGELGDSGNTGDIDNFDDNSEIVDDYYNVDYPEVSEDHTYGNFDSLQGENENNNDSDNENENNNENVIDTNEYNEFDDLDNKEPEGTESPEINNDFANEEIEEPESDYSFESDGEQNVETEEPESPEKPEIDVNEDNDDLLSNLNSQVEESNRINEIQPVESENNYNPNDLEKPVNEIENEDDYTNNFANSNENEYNGEAESNNYNFSDLEEPDNENENVNEVDNEVYNENENEDNYVDDYVNDDNEIDNENDNEDNYVNDYVNDDNENDAENEAEGEASDYSYNFSDLEEPDWDSSDYYDEDYNSDNDIFKNNNY